MENSTDQSKKGRDLFTTMVGLLGLNTEVEDKVSGKSIVLSVKTDEPGRLIGRNGSSLDSIGLLMNRILKKDDFEFPKVIIDVDGYEKKKNKKRKKGAGRKDRSRKIDKTIALQDEPVKDERSEDGGINFYVEDGTDALEPITTVALDGGNSGGNNRKGGRNHRSQTTKMNRNNHREPRAAKPTSQQNKTQKPPMPPSNEKGSGKKTDRLQMQCRNSAKEVKRWGEDILLPPMVEEDCQKVLEYFKSEKEISATISDRNYGDKKRVRISLNN